MISMKAPCKDCTNRYESCHSSCDSYKEWKSALIADKAIIAESRRKEAELRDRQCEVVAKLRKRRRAQ